LILIYRRAFARRFFVQICQMVMPFFVTYLPAKKNSFFKNIQHIIFAGRNAAEIERCVTAKKYAEKNFKNNGKLPVDNKSPAG
jgi:hypothetical protein